MKRRTNRGPRALREHRELQLKPLFIRDKDWTSSQLEKMYLVKIWYDCLAVPTGVCVCVLALKYVFSRSSMKVDGRVNLIEKKFDKILIL